MELQELLNCDCPCKDCPENDWCPLCDTEEEHEPKYGG